MPSHLTPSPLVPGESKEGDSDPASPPSQGPDHRTLLIKLGNRIRRLRRERGLTQEHIAEAADLSVAYVSLIERGSRNPAFTTLAVIARALGLSVAQLCEGEEPR